MYSRKTKIFFGFMVFVMGIGFPLSLVASFPAFQSLLTGQSTGNDSTRKLIDEAHKVIRQRDCADAAKPPKGADLEKCKRALEDLGSGYSVLSQPRDEAGQDIPADADKNREKSLEAFELLYRIDPTEQDSQRFLALAYQQQGKFERALPIFRLLEKENPEDPDFVFPHALTAQQVPAAKAEAISAFRRFLKMAPDDVRAQQAKDAIKALKQPAGAAGEAGAPVNIG